MSNFAGGIQSLGLALKRYLIPNHSPLFSLPLSGEFEKWIESGLSTFEIRRLVAEIYFTLWTSKLYGRIFRILYLLKYPWLILFSKYIELVHPSKWKKERKKYVNILTRCWFWLGKFFIFRHLTVCTTDSFWIMDGNWRSKEILKIGIFHLLGISPTKSNWICWKKKLEI